MDSSSFLFWALALAPAALMSASAGLACIRNVHTSTAWKVFRYLSALALLFALLNLVLLWAMPAQDPGAASAAAPKWLAVSLLGAWVAALVQLLGTVIGTFSSRYLQGEPGQTRYVGAFSAVLTAVHLLLLANHWVILVAAWAAVGLVLQRLLCFYPNRPFALLAAHKKRIADRLADLLLIAAAALVWRDLGSLYLSDLWLHLAQGSVSLSLQLSAVCLTLAVILRSAQLPVHGWLIQVMEAPTPVSALLHAGVVNLGGFILIRFAPLLEAAVVGQGRANFSGANDDDFPLALQAEYLAKVRGELMDGVSKTPFPERSEKRQVFAHLRRRSAAKLREFVAQGGFLAASVQIFQIAEIHGQAANGRVSDPFHGMAAACEILHKGRCTIVDLLGGSARYLPTDAIPQS